MASGEFGALLAHVDLKLLDKRLAPFRANSSALLGILAINRPLDVEQGVDPAHHLDRDGRERDRLLARSAASGVLLNVGHGEERAPGVNPTPRLHDGAGTSAG